MANSAPEKVRTNSAINQRQKWVYPRIQSLLEASSVQNVDEWLKVRVKHGNVDLYLQEIFHGPRFHHPWTACTVRSGQNALLLPRVIQIVKVVIWPSRGFRTAKSLSLECRKMSYDDYAGGSLPLEPIHGWQFLSAFGHFGRLLRKGNSGGVSPSFALNIWHDHVELFNPGSELIQDLAPSVAKSFSPYSSYNRRNSAPELGYEQEIWRIGSHDSLMDLVARGRIVEEKEQDNAQTNPMVWLEEARPHWYHVGLRSSSAQTNKTKTEPKRSDGSKVMSSPKVTMAFEGLLAFVSSYHLLPGDSRHQASTMLTSSCASRASLVSKSPLCDAIYLLTLYKTTISALTCGLERVPELFPMINSGVVAISCKVVSRTVSLAARFRGSSPLGPSTPNAKRNQIDNGQPTGSERSSYKRVSDRFSCSRQFSIYRKCLSRDPKPTLFRRHRPVHQGANLHRLSSKGVSMNSLPVSADRDHTEPVISGASPVEADQNKEILCTKMVLHAGLGWFTKTVAPQYSRMHLFFDRFRPLRLSELELWRHSKTTKKLSSSWSKGNKSCSSFMNWEPGVQVHVWWIMDVSSTEFMSFVRMLEGLGVTTTSTVKPRCTSVHLLQALRCTTHARLNSPVFRRVLASTLCQIYPKWQLAEKPATAVASCAELGIPADPVPGADVGVYPLPNSTTRSAYVIPDSSRSASSASSPGDAQLQFVDEQETCDR
ncbi:hypothetical protein C8J56DRAFT_907772 [Mycena floridula]|nr:hypothetical protein C8J56DRAFT_907772 [Mycena floridula]